MKPNYQHWYYLHPELRNQCQLTSSFDSIEPGWGMIWFTEERHRAEGGEGKGNPLSVPCLLIAIPAPPTNHGGVFCMLVDQSWAVEWHSENGGQVSLNSRRSSRIQLWRSSSVWICSRWWTVCTRQPTQVLLGGSQVVGESDLSPAHREIHSIIHLSRRDYRSGNTG